MASLIYHAGALGDFITTLPAIARWRAERSSERQIFLGKPAHAALVPPFDEIWDVEAPDLASLFGGSADSTSLRAEKISTVTSALLFSGPSSPLAATLERLGARGIVRQDPLPASIVHVIDYHLSLFRPAAGRTPNIPRIILPQEAGSYQETAAIHPGSGSPRKNWPRGRFLELAERLAEHGLRICWVIGPAEAEIEPPAGGEAWRSLPLPVLAARLARCRLYVGNDSGVTHLAAASGCRTVALFGGSDPRVWAPRGVQVRVVDASSAGWEAMRVGDVFSACLDFLKEK